MTAAIEFDHVSKRFTMQRGQPRSFQEIAVNLFRRNNHRREEFWTLRDVSFTVQPGETVGIIGPNGVGKSTVLKLISRIIHPTSGRITTHGRIGALLELGAGFHPDLTGRENIYLNGSIMGMSRAQTRQSLDEIIAFTELDRFIDMPVKHYSSGMYVRLGFAIAVQVRPDILLIDEILAVGDQVFQQKCIERIGDLKREGVTIVLVSHSLGDVWNLCQRAIWLQDGKIKADGDSTVVTNEYLAYTNERYRQHLLRQAAEKAKKPPAESAPAEEKKRWGSREIEITQVELLDAAGQPCSVFQTNRPFTIRLHYYARQPIRNPAFGIGLYHQNGLNIIGPNTKHSRFETGTVQGRGALDFRIDALPLLKGRYELSVAVYDDSLTHAYDHHERMYSFAVEPGNLDELFGNFYIPCKWQFANR